MKYKMCAENKALAAVKLSWIPFWNISDCKAFNLKPGELNGTVIKKERKTAKTTNQSRKLLKIDLKERYLFKNV